MTKVSTPASGKIDKVSTPAALSRALRTALGNITQAELAARLLVSRNYISQIEAELKKPSDRLLKQMNDLLTESVGRDYSVSIPAAPVVSEAEIVRGVTPSDHAAIHALKRQLREEWEILLAAAKDRPDRLHWIQNQMREYLARPKHWLTSDEINQLARDLARQTREAVEREEQSLRPPSQHKKVPA